MSAVVESILKCNSIAELMSLYHPNDSNLCLFFFKRLIQLCNQEEFIYWHLLQHSWLSSLKTHNEKQLFYCIRIEIARMKLLCMTLKKCPLIQDLIMEGQDWFIEVDDEFTFTLQNLIDLFTGYNTDAWLQILYQHRLLLRIKLAVLCKDDHIKQEFMHISMASIFKWISYSDVLYVKFMDAFLDLFSVFGDDCFHPLDCFQLFLQEYGEDKLKDWIMEDLLFLQYFMKFLKIGMWRTGDMRILIEEAIKSSNMKGLLKYIE